MGAENIDTVITTLQVPPGAVVKSATPAPISPFTGHSKHLRIESWNINTPIDGFHSYLDEILIHTLSFLDTKSLLKAGRVCTKWQKLSSNDILWKTRLDSLQISFTEQGIECPPCASGFKESFLALQHRFYYLYKNHELFKSERIMFYSLTALFIICLPIGSILGTVLAGLFFDGIIISSALNVFMTLIPYILLYFIPYVLLACGWVYYLVLSRKRRRYSQKLTLAGEMESNKIHVIDESLIITIASSTLLVCLYFAWLAIVPLCLYLRFLVPTAPFVALLSPVYFLGLAYVLVPPIVFIKNIRFLPSLPMLEFPKAAYIIGVYIQVFIMVQAALIGAKLDGFITIPWILVAIPYWASAALWIVLPPLLIFFIFKFTNCHKRLKISLIIAYFGGVVISPFSIFSVIHFSTTLDAVWGGKVAFSYSSSLIAVYFTIFAIASLVIALTIYLARPVRVFPRS
jgi:hypothetical protein